MILQRSLLFLYKKYYQIITYSKTMCNVIEWLPLRRNHFPDRKRQRTLYRYILKPILFRFVPEKAHNITVGLFKTLLSIPGGAWITKQMFGYESKNSSVTIDGLTFPNAVGLAAGFDKDGKYYHDMSKLGFGFVEIGTVTPLPQGGNPQPRLFRVPADKGIINRMGFNNDGVDAMVERIKKYGKPDNCILGGNIGKNKVTPNDKAVDDYIICFEKLYDLVDYFVVNVSSPNTPGLRELQDKKPLSIILNALTKRNKDKKPLFLKIAPDLTEGQLNDIIELVEETGITGLIATNTTINRDGLSTDSSKIESIGNGGLSGAPLTKRATEVIKYLHDKSNGAFPIIGVGGITNGQDAVDKIKAGASLVQIYSGLIYSGPELVKESKKAIAAM